MNANKTTTMIANEINNVIRSLNKNTTALQPIVEAALKASFDRKRETREYMLAHHADHLNRQLIDKLIHLATNAVTAIDKLMRSADVERNPAAWELASIRSNVMDVVTASAERDAIAFAKKIAEHE